MIDDNMWDKIENKTNVKKNTIIDLAKKLQSGGLKNKDSLNEIIDTLSLMTGKKVSEEKRKKIIDKITNDEVPNNVDKMF